MLLYFRRCRYQPVRTPTSPPTVDLSQSPSAQVRFKISLQYQAASGAWLATGGQRVRTCFRSQRISEISWLQQSRYQQGRTSQRWAPASVTTLSTISVGLSSARPTYGSQGYAREAALPRSTVRPCRDIVGRCGCQRFLAELAQLAELRDAHPAVVLPPAAERRVAECR
jgi:hypothetical protein